MSNSKLVRLSSTVEIPGVPSFQTHELDVLLRLSGQEARVKRQHFALWNAVAPGKRLALQRRRTIQKADAESMISAAEQLLKVL